VDWQGKIKDLQSRRDIALEMGGQEKIQRQHEQGKLTARERLTLLFDDGEFSEYGLLATSPSERLKRESKKTLADGVIIDYGKIIGRSVCCIAEDFTVLGGSVGQTHWFKYFRTVQMARKANVPIVWMMDGAGARSEETINMGLPHVNHFLEIFRHSGIAPYVAIAMEPCSGDSLPYIDETYASIALTVKD
jgi:acetyl-CoA carboxylase carboxyltransferase component